MNETQPLPTDEHPAAKRMREQFEAQYGDMSGIVLAMRAWRTTRNEYDDAWNRDRERPITEDDVDAAESAVLDAVRTRGTPAPVGVEPVAYLWQHSETGRLRVVMPDQIVTTEATWRVIGPLVLAMGRVPLTSAQMAAGREAIFSTNNPYCPCDSKTFRKVAEWVERYHGIKGLENT